MLEQALNHAPSNFAPDRTGIAAPARDRINLALGRLALRLRRPGGTMSRAAAAHIVALVVCLSLTCKHRFPRSNAIKHSAGALAIRLDLGGMA